MSLSEAMVREMLKPQVDHVGLGFFVGENKNPEEFEHNGGDEGFQGVLIMLSDSGKGAAVMANSDNGVSLANFLVESIAKEYGWNYTPAKQSAGEVLSLIAAARDLKTALQEYSQLKNSASPTYELDENSLLQLGYRLLRSGRREEAIQVLKLEVRDYPKYWNAYDSLGPGLRGARSEGPGYSESREIHRNEPTKPGGH